MTDPQNRQEAGYIGYEYRQITVPEALSSLCLDSYSCFGWEPDPNREQGARTPPRHSQAGEKAPRVTLYFRRSRAIAAKAELTRLQRNFDGCVAELEALERAKTTAATIWALTVALAGTAFMAGATFAATAQPPLVWLTVLLAIPGFGGWIAPAFLFRWLVRKQTAKIEPLIEQKYDEIDQICEKGSRLLH